MWSTLLAFIQVESKNRFWAWWPWVTYTCMVWGKLSVKSKNTHLICNNLKQILRFSFENKRWIREEKHLLMWITTLYVYVHMQRLLTLVISIVYRKLHKIMTVFSAHYVVFVFCISVYYDTNRTVSMTVTCWLQSKIEDYWETEYFLVKPFYLLTSLGSVITIRNLLIYPKCSCH